MKPLFGVLGISLCLASAQVSLPTPEGEPAVEREWGSQSGAYRLSISAQRKQYRPGETILVTATLKNVGDEPVACLMSSYPMLFYAIDVRAPTPDWWPQKQQAMLTARGYAEKHPLEMSTMGCTLDPGRENSRTLELNKLFQMTAPGEYRITFSCKEPLKKLGDPDVTITSNELAITVIAKQ